MNIDILGDAEFKRMILGLPEELRPAVIRQISRGPALAVANEARQRQPFGRTERTAKTIGVMRIKNANQPFLVVGYRGRSLGNIFASADEIPRRKRGILKGYPRLFHESADKLFGEIRRGFKADIEKVVARGMKKHGYI